jgi:hypothetical protein
MKFVQTVVLTLFVTGCIPHPGSATAVDGGTPAAPITSWSTESTNQLVGALWGSSAGDVYAVGGPPCTILHSTGDGHWSAQTCPSAAGSWLSSIWGASAHDLYAVGDGGVILHSTGDGVWSAQPSGETLPLSVVWGTGASDIYVGGNAGAMLHSVGDGTWTRQATPTDKLLVGIWGSAPDNLYAVATSNDHKTSDSVVMRSSGDGSWRAQALPGDFMLGIWGSGPKDIYVSGLGGIVHSAGDDKWTAEDTSFEPQRVWGTQGAIYSVGTSKDIGGGGVIGFSTGDGKWTTQPAKAAGFLLDVWGSSADDVYLAATGGILHGVRR